MPSVFCSINADLYQGGESVARFRDPNLAAHVSMILNAEARPIKRLNYQNLEAIAIEIATADLDRCDWRENRLLVDDVDGMTSEDRRRVMDWRNGATWAEAEIAKRNKKRTKPTDTIMPPFYQSKTLAERIWAWLGGLGVILFAAAIVLLAVWMSLCKWGGLM